MKYVYLTVDVEEWYDLDYLKNSNLQSTGVEVIPKIIDFLDMLDENRIKATFFVLADLVERNADIIREIADRGHAIGCHGLDHKLLYEKSNDDFFKEITDAKARIEKAVNCSVDGYRASCFSMERDKLELVKEAGYKYDSSKILFEQHPLYRNLDLNGFDKIDDLVYRQCEFMEYEVPTLHIGKFDIPISGGGYLRLLPYWLIKILLKKYERNKENFLIYVHPFELTDMYLPFPKDISIKSKIRALIGRRNNLRKLCKVIKLLKEEGAEFRTLSEDRESRLKSGREV